MSHVNTILEPSSKPSKKSKNKEIASAFIQRSASYSNIQQRQNNNNTAVAAGNKIENDKDQ